MMMEYLHNTKKELRKPLALFLFTTLVMPLLDILSKDGPLSGQRVLRVSQFLSGLTSSFLQGIELTLVLLLDVNTLLFLKNKVN